MDSRDGAIEPRSSAEPLLRPVVFTIDNRYIKPLAVALAGLLNHSKYPRKVYIGYEYLHPIYRWMLRRWLFSSSIDLVLLRIRVSHGIQELPHHFTPAVLLRLCVSNSIKESEFIYLDADVLIKNDLEKLDQIFLDDALLAASPRPEGRTHIPNGVTKYLEQFSGKPYFATGLLLINTRRFESQQVGKQCLKMISERSFDYPDQDALNLVCQEQPWKPLPRGLSLEIDDRPLPPGQWVKEGKERKHDVEDQAIVLQLAGSEKPWHLWNRHPLRQEFREVLRQTPFSYLPCGLSDIRWRSLLSRCQRWLVRSLQSPSNNRRNGQRR